MGVKAPKGRDWRKSKNFGTTARFDPTVTLPQAIKRPPPAVIVTLSGTVVWKVVARQSAPNRLSRSETSIQAKHQTGPIVPATQIDRLLGGIPARPVFSPDRRPVASSSNQSNRLLRPTGIVVTLPRKVAIFAAPSDGRPLAGHERHACWCRRFG